MKSGFRQDDSVQNTSEIAEGVALGAALGDDGAPLVESLLYFIDLSCPAKSSFSPNLKRMLGYEIADIADITANWWMQFAHPDDVADLAPDGLPYPACNAALTRRFRLRHKDGHWLDVVDQAMKVPCGKTGHFAVVGTLSNLTLHRKISRALYGSNQRYQHLLETMPDGVVVYDIEGRVVQSNPAAQDLLGLSADQLLGRDSFDPKWCSIDPSGAPFTSEKHPAMVALRDRVPVYGVVMGIRRPDNSQVWVRINAQPLFVPGTDTLDGVVVSFSDVTELKNAEQAMSERENLYRQMFDRNPAVKLLIDPVSGKIVDANKAACEFYGYGYDVLRSMVISQINLSQDGTITKSMQDAVNNGSAVFSFKHRLANGAVRDVRVNSGRIMLNGQEYINSIVFDVTERNEYERRLIEANRQLQIERQRLDEIIRATNAGTWEWNIQTGDMRLNERWAEIIGYTLEELSPCSVDRWISLCHPDDINTINALLIRHFDHEIDQFDCEYRLKHKNGSWVWVLDRGKVFEWSDDGAPLRLSGTHSDITPAKEIEERIRHMALSDPLTGLANRHQFDDRLLSAIEHCTNASQNVVLMLLDLDHFKSVNDTYGHPVGDALLVDVAQGLQAQFRGGDFIARLGGDEFAVLLTDVADIAIAKKAAERVIREIDRPRKIEGNTVHVGVSIGISINSGTTDILPKVLYRRADRALYQSKEEGRNTFRVYQPKPVKNNK
ncbi:PAS domain S-box protein [Thalassospira sp. MCCC 1A01428]|uniref:PAS domain S-box protein n=1 Tax=Thalassospira sp. MCCC 1A01428 TaxID=1470575 RepID=UPI000A1FECBF|nr:PAS domain S-box protein [Thalassospira sp. MCCC 1A01428]